MIVVCEELGRVPPDAGSIGAVPTSSAASAAPDAIGSGPSLAAGTRASAAAGTYPAVENLSSRLCAYGSGREPDAAGTSSAEDEFKAVIGIPKTGEPGP